MRASFDPFTLDAASRRLERDGAEVHLTPKAFDFLALVVAQAPRVVRKRSCMRASGPRPSCPTPRFGVVKEVRRALAEEAAHSDCTSSGLCVCRRAGTHRR